MATGRSGAPQRRRPGSRGHSLAGPQAGSGYPGGRGGGQRSTDPAREAALDVLRAVADRDAYANLLLPSVLRERGLTGRDAALATELTYGALRGRGTYDSVLAGCSARPLARIDPAVLDVLRLGTHQLLATRVRPHAAVATSVELARQVAGPGPAGFVNAVLRKVATRDAEAWIREVAPDRQRDPAGHLSVRYSHPRWIVAAFADALGEDLAGCLTETEAVLAANANRPAVTLCAVPGRATAADLAAAGAQAARWSPFGAYLSHGDPAGLAPVRDGHAAVQDEASQLAALALTRVDVGTPGGRWLDMCAGPGGKARLLAGLAPGQGARLLAADIRWHRARMVRSALSPAALGKSPGQAGAQGTGGGSAADGIPLGDGSGAAAVVADGASPAWQAGAFDRVLADVPCSGLGALRRRPEARWRKSPRDVTGLGRLQRDLLASALDAARPGGVVAYVTCSPHVAETAAVVADVIGRRGDVTVLDAPAVLSEVPGLRCPAPHEGYAQFWPHRHGTDAIFLALLARHP